MLFRPAFLCVRGAPQKRGLRCDLAGFLHPTCRCEHRRIRSLSCGDIPHVSPYFLHCSPQAPLTRCFRTSSELGVTPDRTENDWRNLLSFASMFSFPSLITTALAGLDKYLQPVEKVVLGDQLGITELTHQGVRALCTRKTFLSRDEGRALGLESVLCITRLREETGCYLPDKAGKLTDKLISESLAQRLVEPAAAAPHGAGAASSPPAPSTTSTSTSTSTSNSTATATADTTSSPPTNGAQGKHKPTPAPGPTDTKKNGDVPKSQTEAGAGTGAKGKGKAGNNKPEGSNGDSSWLSYLQQGV